MRHPEWDRLIKQYRFQFGLTQQCVAALLGVSQKTISRWESGENKPGFLHQKRFRDLFREPSSIAPAALLAAVKACPAARALCLHENLNLKALSWPAIAKRPAMANWIGRSLYPIARGVLAGMLDDRALQRSIEKGEIACVTAMTRSNFEEAGAPSATIYRTTITFFRVDNFLLRDAISVPAPASSELGYWPLPQDEMVSGDRSAW